MNNNIKILFAVFFATTSAFIIIITFLINEKIKQQLVSEKEIVNITYNTIIDSYRTNANIIYFNKLDTKEIKETIFNAFESTEKKKLDIRNKLYDQLQYMYNNMYSFRIKQLHFHLKNNESFLRFHRPEKFGDDLTNIRATVKYVNENKQAIQGFEEGRIFNGYRFVYPLSYKMKYLGSVEVSVSMNAIIHSLNKEFNSNVDFIIKKDVVDKKVFTSEKQNYRVCKSNPNYYHEFSITKRQNKIMEDIVTNYEEKNKKAFLEKNKSNKIFNFTSTYKGKRYITTYLPIKNAVTKDKVAYLIITREHPSLEDSISKLKTSLLFFLLLNSLFFYFLFKSEKRKIQLKHKDEILDDLQVMGHIGYWERDNIENKLIWSEEFYNILDCKKGDITPSYKNFMKLIHKDDIKKVKKKYKDFVEDLNNYNIEFRIKTLKGKTKFVEQEAHHIYNNENKTVRSIGTLRDVTEIKKFQIKAELAHDKLYKFIDLQKNIVILTDGKRLNFANKSFFDFFNYKNLAHFLEDYNCICDLFLEDNNYFNLTKVEEQNQWIFALQELPQSYRVVAINDKNGIKKAFSVTINSFQDNYFIVSFTDITETILINQALQEKTIHDKLTNAYNREYFDVAISSLVNKYEKNELSTFSLCLIDIDFFKKINDTYGHDIGDKTLIDLVKIINSSIRKDDTLIRWGGEEFILLMQNDSNETLQSSLEHIREIITTYNFEKIGNLTCSFGATIYKKDENIENTIKRADVNLYTAKETGRDKIVIS